MARQTINDQFARIEVIRSLPYLSATEKALLKELALRGNTRGVTFVGNKQLGADIGLSERWVRKRLKALEDQNLIRRWRRKRPDGSLGTYQTAVTLPLGSAACGTMNQYKQEDSSGLNIKDQYKSKTWNHRHRLLEDKVLNILMPVIDCEKSPHLVSVYEVTQWALEQKEIEWATIVSQIEQQATRLMKALADKGEKLNSWDTLAQQLQARHDKHACAVSTSPPPQDQSLNPEHPIAGQLKGCLLSSGQMSRRLQVFMNDCRFEETAEMVIIHPSRLYEAKMMASEAGKAFQKLAKHMGMSVIIKFKDDYLKSWSPSASDD